MQKIALNGAMEPLLLGIYGYPMILNFTVNNTPDLEALTDFSVTIKLYTKPDFRNNGSHRKTLSKKNIV